MGVMQERSSTNMFIGGTRLEWIATGTLAAATLIVGASIVADGSLARGLNGLAGITWFASSAMFLVEGRRRGSTGIQWAGVVGFTAAVAFVIKPTDLVLATIGFCGAGIVAGLFAGRDPVFWAKMIPALYLPLHIGTAVLKSVGRNALGIESSIRTEPPPTAAVVPAVMLVAAIAGGWIATRIRSSRNDSDRASTVPDASR